jgi:Right handed beta helix region
VKLFRAQSMNSRQFSLLAFSLVVAVGILAWFASRPATSAPRFVAPAQLGNVPSGQAARGTTSGVEVRRPSRGCTRYAAPSGSDRNPGTKPRPFKTAQRLAERLRAGQTGCLRAGVYDDVEDGYVLHFERGGAPGMPVTIRSYPGERARLVGTVDVPDDVDHVRIAHLAVEGTGGSNTVKIYGDDAVLEDSELTNFGRGDSCLILGSTSGGVAHRPIVRRNRFHDCGDPGGEFGHGIYASQVTDGRIINNVFWNSYGYAIQVYPNAQRTLVARNVIDGGGISNRGGITVGGDDETASNDNVIERNVIAYAVTYGVKAQSVTGSGNVVRYNCFWQNSDGHTNSGVVAHDNIVAPPLFVNRRRHDYRLGKTSRCRRVVPLAKAAAPGFHGNDGGLPPGARASDAEQFPQ